MDRAVRRDEPEAVRHGRARCHGAGDGTQFFQHGATRRNGRRAQRIVEHDRHCRGSMTAARDANERARRRGRDADDRGDAQEHQQQIAQLQIPAVLALRARQIAHRGKLHARPGAAAEEVNEQRDRGGCRRDQPERCEKLDHGILWRVANTRRSGTPNGASVTTVS